MDLPRILRYLDGSSPAGEARKVERWLQDDADGSNARLYRDAHDIYDTLVLHPQSPAGIASKASNWRKVLTWTLATAASVALVLIAAHAGRSSARHEFEALSESVSVPAGRTLELTLEDGTRVWLNSGTEISYPKIFGRKSRSLTLLRGEVLMDVTKDESRPFTVETPSANVKVYGTRFDMASDADRGIFTVTLYRGSIGVTPACGDGEIMLKSGQTLTLDPDGEFRRGQIGPDDPSAFWTEGMVNIAGSDFRELMDRLEKAFGTTIMIKREKLPEYSISRGRVRVVDGIDHALDVVGLAADFKYKHDYNTDTIIIL